MKPFDLCQAISTSKNNIWDDIEESDYIPFMTNRFFSYHPDTIMLANEMNRLPLLPKKMQYDFLRLAITPKRKRFAKWAKPEEDSLIDMISEAYQVNRQRAIIMRKLLSTEAIEQISSTRSKGGR